MTIILSIMHPCEIVAGTFCGTPSRIAFLERWSPALAEYLENMKGPPSAEALAEWQALKLEFPKLAPLSEHTASG